LILKVDLTRHFDGVTIEEGAQAITQLIQWINDNCLQGAIPCGWEVDDDNYRIFCLFEFNNDADATLFKLRWC
jgi:hypothetical protein